MENRSRSMSYGSTDDRSGSGFPVTGTTTIQGDEQEMLEEQQRQRLPEEQRRLEEQVEKRLSRNCVRMFIIVLLALVLISASFLIITSAFPAFETKSNQVDLGDISEGLNGSGVITIDDKVSTVQLTLIQPLRDDVQVNIFTSSAKPPLSFTTLKENIQIDVPLKGKFRAGCNILLYDEPIYLQPNSQLKYEITSSNYVIMNQLCYFNNSHDYTKFLNNYTFEYDSKFCFNISDGNAIIDITIKEASPYYVAIDTGGNTSFSVDITIIRSYYNIKMLDDLSPHCSLNENSNFSCIIKICDGYFCDQTDPTKIRYVIVETSHHIVLKYDTLITFYFKPTVRVIFFSCSMIFETIAVMAAIIMIYKLWRNRNDLAALLQSCKNGEETKLKHICKGVIIAIIVLLVMSLHLIAIAFVTMNTYDLLVNSNNQLVGNKYPVLLNPQGFNKSMSNVEITLSFPSADSVSVYKVPCNSLKISSTKLGPNRILPMTLVHNSRTGFNFNKYSIPLNLAPGSIIAYNIDVSSTLPFKSGTCISLTLMNSFKAYDEFLSTHTNFTDYIIRSDCLVNGDNYVNFTVKDKQNDYYVGIETNIDINVSAEVSVVQVYYDLSDTEVYTSLSVYKPSCNVRVCEKIFCINHQDTCILVNATSFDFISYTPSHKFLSTRSIGSTSLVFFCLSAICITLVVILSLLVFVCFGYWGIKKIKVCCSCFKEGSSSKIICILINFITILIFQSVFIPIIYSHPVIFSGKAWVNNTKDFVLVDLKHKGFVNWSGTHDITFSVETDSISSDISLYTVNCEAIPKYHASTNKNKIECNNFISSCVLNEFIYLVKTEQDYVNYSISISSNISGFLFCVSTFDDYKQYENFLARKPYIPLHRSASFTNGKTFNFSFSHIYMKQKAAYYHFVLHPAFETDVYKFSQYSTSSSVQMESTISLYTLSGNYRPQCNITKNSTSICSINDNICVVLARANMLTNPVLLNAVTTKQESVPLTEAVVLALIVIIPSVFFALIIFIAVRSTFSKCSGPSNNDHIQQPPSLTCEQPPSPTCDQPPSPTCDQPPSPTCEQPPSPTCDQPPSTTCDQPPSPTCDQPPSPTCDQPPSPTCDQPQSHQDNRATSMSDRQVESDDLEKQAVKQTDKLEGVAGSKLFQIQNSLSKVVLHWEEYGLRIKVPEGAVPPSETIEVTITALVGGDFILPEDSELVSAVYAITVSEPSSSLLKPVTLEIQHCVSIETLSHASDLSFVISSSDNGPFQFQDKGSFLVGERYGSIDVTTFSSWAIIQTIKGWFKKFRHSNRSITPQADRSLMQDALPVLWYYVAQPLYENQRLGREWLLMFLFGRDLNAIKMYMKNEFKRSKGDRELFFKFESIDGCIEIHTDTENRSKGWSIRPHQENPTKVSRNTIDEYGHKTPPDFPKCYFTITATPGSNTNPELEHPVTFKGIISDNTVFKIVLTMDTIDPSPIYPKEIFREQYAALSDLLMIPENIAAIAKHVYSEGLITDDTLQDCMTDARRPADRAHSLLNALRATIDQPDVLEKLIQVLKNNEAFRSIAEKMERDI